MSALFIAAGAARIARRAPFGWSALGFGALGLAVLGFILVRPNWLESAETLAGRMGATSHVARARLNELLYADDDLGTGLAARAGDSGGRS